MYCRLDLHVNYYHDNSIHSEYFRLLEDILKACSRALHQVISSWILEGELRPGVMWMVSLDEDDHNDTFESTNKGQLDNSSLISLKIKDDLIPRALRNSYDLVEKVICILNYAY